MRPRLQICQKNSIFELQARRRFQYEREVCRKASHVIAVSAADAQTKREWLGLRDASCVGTGVDVDYFSPTDPPPAAAVLVFVETMNLLPNIDGIRLFIQDVLPLIRRQMPDVPLAIAGREPSAEIRDLRRRDPRIIVTGTVPDIRPYLWVALVSIVPLRIGGGTRLKIYESMAARVPVASTAIGAEGLTVHPPSDIRIADSAEGFAAECIELLQSAESRRSRAEVARRLVEEHFSWDRIATDFEGILEQTLRVAV
jgi:glycosyltransferase involved in cell wall biosynthesis